MRSYLQHGRRHGQDGSDPILGLTADLAWCYTNGDIDTDGSSHPSLAAIDTTDSSIFALNGGSDGIEINAPGAYLAVVNVDIEDNGPAVTTAFTLTTVWTGNPPPSDRIKGPVSQTGSPFGAQRRWEPSTIDLANVTTAATLTYVVDGDPAVTLNAYTTVFVVRIGPSLP